MGFTNQLITEGHHILQVANRHWMGQTYPRIRLCWGFGGMNELNMSEQKKNAASYADQVWFMIDKWYAFNCIYIYAFINQLLTRVYAYKHLFMHTNMCVYINTHTCVYIYIHTHINTHANPRTPCWFLLLGCNICVGAHMTLLGSKEGASVQNADTLFRTCFRYSKLHVCIYI